MILEQDCWFLSQDVQILLPLKKDSWKKYIFIKDNDELLPYQNVYVWPPSTADLEITFKIPDQILKLLIWLRNLSDDDH